MILSYRFWRRRVRQDLSGSGCREEVAGSHCRSNQASEDGSVGRNSVKNVKSINGVVRQTKEHFILFVPLYSRVRRIF